MHSDVVISVKNLTKTYRIFGHPGDRIKQALTFGRSRYYSDFTALKDVSFEIKRGESLGVIGRNGSGKSTLLQLICGILKPTSGEVKVNGRISALLELGSGFNPEFTGRENVYFQGAVMGFTQKQINERINDIVAFADIGEFIDQPVRTYSSGMFVRLAFAVIASVDPEILVIDEALAVGDVFFQQKCMRFLSAFKSKGGTILFVSHDTNTVLTLCDRAILIAPAGKESIHIGSAAEICKEYVKRLYSRLGRPDDLLPKFDGLRDATAHGLRTARPTTEFKQVATFKSMKARYQTANFRKNAESFGQFGAKIIDAWFEDSDGSQISTFAAEELITLCVAVNATQYIGAPAFGFTIKNYLGQLVISEGTEYVFPKKSLCLLQAQVCQVRFSFEMPTLLQGEYSIALALAELVEHGHFQHHWLEDAIALHCTGGRLVQGISGVANLKVEVSGASLYSESRS
jgi:lipopolysaccharide transport system ATP-binding protein